MIKVYIITPRLQISTSYECPVFPCKIPEQYTLTINLVGSSIKGKVNEANTSAKFAINLDSYSKIILDRDSY